MAEWLTNTWHLRPEFARNIAPKKSRSTEALGALMPIVRQATGKD
jgi:hypothetical protein